jgi:AcrR family transcriptional regulator
MADRPKRAGDEAGLRERHKRGRRSAILGAVRDILREGDIDKLTKEAIAQRAQVAPATVYNLVGTRTRIFEALADDFMDELEARQKREPACEPLRRARRLIELTLDVILADPDVYKHVIRSWNESGLVLRRGPATPLIAAIEEAKQLGLLVAEAEARLLASSVATACVGAVHQWAAGLIGDRGLRARALFSLDLALAAVASDAQRPELLRVLSRPRASETRRPPRLGETQRPPRTGETRPPPKRSVAPGR